MDETETTAFWDALYPQLSEDDPNFWTEATEDRPPPTG